MTLLLIALLMTPVGAVWNGWVLSILWGWFIVPVFDAPVLSIAYAIGLGMIVSFLTYRRADKQADNFASAVIELLGVPLVFLAMGWVVKLFV